jgi:hypothetical protein
MICRNLRAVTADERCAAKISLIKLFLQQTFKENLEIADFGILRFVRNVKNSGAVPDNYQNSSEI